MRGVFILRYVMNLVCGIAKQALGAGVGASGLHKLGSTPLWHMFGRF